MFQIYISTHISSPVVVFVVTMFVRVSVPPAPPELGLGMPDVVVVAVAAVVVAIVWQDVLARTGVGV